LIGRALDGPQQTAGRVDLAMPADHGPHQQTQSFSLASAHRFPGPLGARAPPSA
jgi:hypothetical protein